MNIGNKLISILLYVYILFQPILPSKYKIGKIPFNGDLILALIILVYIFSIIVFSSSRKRFIDGIKDFFKSYISIFIFALILIMFMSISYAADKKVALSETVRFSTYIILFFIIKYELNSRRIVDMILKLYIFTISVVGVIGLFEGIVGIGFIQRSQHGIRDRVMSTMENSNNLGAVMVIAIFPVVMLALNERNRRRKVIFSFLALLFLVNIVISFSRNAWLGFVIGCLMLALTYNWKIILTLAGLGGISIFVPAISNRLAEFTDASQNLSRIKLWDIAIFMIKDHPIRGVGNGNYRVLYDKYKLLLKKKIEYYPSNNFHPHNILLKIQSELGIFGTFTFVGVMIFIVLRIIKFNKNIKDKFYTPFFKGFLASLIAFISMNCIDNFFSAPKVIAFFWILIACSEAVLYRQKPGGGLYY
ncbi:MAG: O-antigen ligase family protein [Clostridium sp.]|jgi:O-antigen ligase|uniref:O-antigen ligase family protein n=1 Tax=Clostridium sp. TaxID=1506 RepID=UPI0025C0CBD6|nr:O-antigen ligase family protein [Clostridium sp.]MCH3962861.1 O-antigen ligase family protein [Clostridium sp.]MCI1715724.1 O-antigen ligase family protein [Clostridium sp.]MCI1800071.1 O-antigen ligase family protein [Clostridium sp.]MCI1813985.1 O-antigen ligase family protein [Clostridium sp.]MCI1870883.1 O-antigen ligase family protein [Clostridium sp.]